MSRYKREIQRTTHLTVEGDAEQILAKILKSGLTCGGKGPAIEIYNARGFGARHVINSSVRVTQRGRYNTRAALFDTDTDWNDQVQAQARRAGILMIPFEPCLEAVLLRIAVLPVPQTTRECKAAFAAAFGGEAHTNSILQERFPIEVLLNARRRVPELDSLMKLFD